MEVKWGQLFLLGYKGLTPSADFLKLIQKYNIGGIIFFSRNITSPHQLKDSLGELKSYFKTAPFLAIDQEGGKINRITKSFPLFSANKYYADRKDKEGLRKAYQTTAKELFKLGINFNLAPVVDVLENEKCFIGERSFGKDISLVCEFSKIAIQSMQKEKILTCAKHFPGIGSLKEDPHKKLPEIKLSKKEFEKKDFLPFKTAIKNGVDAIMTTHVIASKLDKKPVTFSKKVVTDILKKKLNFKGLVLTDDMEMDAIANNFDFKEACKNAFLAGHEVILICHSLERQQEVLEYFDGLIRDKKLPLAKLRQTSEKILKFKREKLL